MTDDRASLPTAAVRLAALDRPLAPIAAVLASFVAVLAAILVGAAVLLFAFSGGVAADAAVVDTPAAPAADVSAAPAADGVGTSTVESGTSTPLRDANGTTEVVVRFTPVENPDSLGESDGDGKVSNSDGEAAIDDLREHASAEQAAFEAFAASREGVTVEREFWLANAMLVTVDADEVDAGTLLSVANVTAVHENVAIEAFDGAARSRTESRPVPAQIEAEPTGRYTAGLRLVDAPTTWERFDTRGAGATVAVIDTGVDPGHRDIDVAGWAAFDENGTLVSDDLADANDPDGHGTHVAGTVAGGNASGTHIGVAPEAELHALDTFAENDTATFAGVIAAMEHATVESDADVLQMSLGASGAFRGFIGPVRNARATGTIVVVAAGNEGANTSSGPGNVYDALAVGAVDDEREVAAFSSGETINATAAFGTYPEEWPEHYVVPDVTAPGVGVVSAEAGTRDGYVRRQGTSMAAPHVAGIAALAVAATDGRANDSAVQAALVDTAIHPAGATAPDDRYGHGVVDAPAAVGAAVEAAPPEPEPTDDSADDPADGNGSDGDRDSDESDARDETDGRAPGFGAVAALVALAAAAMASTRGAH